MVRGGVAAALAAAMVGQMQSGAGTRGADVRSLRYERVIEVPAGHAGAVCAVLDATTLEHMASRSGDDLRVFAEAGGVAEAVPFRLTESEVTPEDDAVATVGHAAVKDGALVFALTMPPRVYSDVVLEMEAKDFVGLATVRAKSNAGQSVLLGSFPVFELGEESLARKVDLPLVESRYAELEVRLQMWRPDGRPLPVTPAMVRGAEVPPSRVAQTLYTPVAVTRSLQHERGETLARFTVPAHVPVGRVRFEMAAAVKGEFARRVVIRAKTKDGTSEEIEGAMWRVQRPGRGGMPAIAQQSLSVEAVLASNLREAAEVTVAIEDGAQPPLPVASVVLEMRQRRVCFAASGAASGAVSYRLRYGDDGLGAAAFEPTVFAVSGDAAAVAVLGPETVNATYVARQRKDVARPTEQLWLVLLAGVAVVGLGVRRVTGRLR